MANQPDAFLVGVSGASADPRTAFQQDAFQFYGFQIYGSPFTPVPPTPPPESPLGGLHDRAIEDRLLAAWRRRRAYDEARRALEQIEPVVAAIDAAPAVAPQKPVAIQYRETLLPVLDYEQLQMLLALYRAQQAFVIARQEEDMAFVLMTMAALTLH